MDKSGSMYPIKNDAIGGFNGFIDEQKKGEDQANVTLVLFDSHVSTTVESIDINKVIPLDEQNYNPRGGTALVDAIGVAIDGLNKRLSEKPVSEQPKNIIFAIMTDGEENSSIRYTADAVKNKIENMKTRDYQFIFLGANIDAVKTAERFGINKDFAGQFTADTDGIKGVMSNVTTMVSNYRSMGNMMTYMDADKVNKGE